MDLFENTSLGRIQSVLSEYQQFSSHKSAVAARPTGKHHSRTSNGSLIQKKLGGSANWPESTEEARTPPEVLWCVSLYKITTNDQQRVARRTNTTQHHPLSVGLYSYPFQTSCVLSVSTLAKNLMPSVQAASRNTPCACFSKNILSARRGGTTLIPALGRQRQVNF